MRHLALKASQEGIDAKFSHTTGGHVYISKGQAPEKLVKVLWDI